MRGEQQWTRWRGCCSTRRTSSVCPTCWRSIPRSTQANKVQLSATVASQVDAARSGMELLESAQKTLSKMQQCYDVRAPIIIS